jgi:hypothetical protein
MGVDIQAKLAREWPGWLRSSGDADAAVTLQAERPLIVRRMQWI